MQQSTVPSVRMDMMFSETYTDKMNQEKTAWTRIGTAWVNFNEDGTVKHVSMKFKAYPAHGEDVVAFIPRPREDQVQEQASSVEINRTKIPTIDVDDNKEDIKVEDIPI